MKAALRLQAVQDGWAAGTGDHAEALAFNRKVWTVLATDATDEGNPLAAPIKTNIGQLAAFIFSRTIACLAEPAPAKLAILIQINRDIASGLRGVGRVPAAAAA